RGKRHGGGGARARFLVRSHRRHDPSGSAVPPWQKGQPLAILAQVETADRRMSAGPGARPERRDVGRLAAGRHPDPGVLLGVHAHGPQATARSLLPGAARAAIADTGAVMQRLDGTDIFEWTGPSGSVPPRFRVTWWDGAGAAHTHYEPYCFPPRISGFDLHLFGEGTHRQAWRFLGAHVAECDGIRGTHFAVWAPNAERVSVVGDFNAWDGRRHPMRSRGSS